MTRPRPSRRRRRTRRSEESTLCIVVKMTLRRDQPTGFAVCAAMRGRRTSAPTSLRRRCARVPSPTRGTNSGALPSPASPVGVVRDVRVLVGVDRRGDRHVVGVVGIRGERGGGGDRLAVRAHEVPEARREPRQRPGLAAAQQQLVRPERPAGEHDAAGAHDAAPGRRAPEASRRARRRTRRTRRPQRPAARRRRAARPRCARRRARRTTGSSSSACSSRRRGSRGCTARSGCSRCGAGPRRRSTGRRPRRRARP